MVWDIIRIYRKNRRTGFSLIPGSAIPATDRKRGYDTLDYVFLDCEKNRGV